MTTLQYAFSSVKKSKLFYITAIVLTMVIIIVRVIFVPTYRTSDVVLHVYPTVLFKTEMTKSAVNPCYKVRRILESHEFSAFMVENSLGQLTRDNIGRRMKIHETPQHLMSVHLYVDDTVAAMSLLNNAAAYLKNTYDTYPSSVLSHASEPMYEAVVPDYHWQLCDSVYVADVIDYPYVVSTPTAKRWIVLVICSLLFSTSVAAAFSMLMSAFANNKQ